MVVYAGGVVGYVVGCYVLDYVVVGCVFYWVVGWAGVYLLDEVFY